eukprot:CAMPEP_0167815710 /NCGR_PEP_ID=MMETSP0112_2-20121227/3178_1 /TAXON_ID=91324 /ORGANISM="Lotharella globosa, Strain CCCM811" /LENGTH=828 /DNA_ID=CAMNT_0007715169 /DNA_START=98 /DNA_END=2587 /DNA_ORIENTATION=-
MQGSFSNRQHVLSAVDKIKEKMSKKDDWKMRYQALEELEKLVKQGSEEDGFASIFDSLSLEFKYILPKQLIDLRSEILRQACQTISTMAECLQEHMRKLGNEIMPNLLLAATTVNRVIRQYAITCCHNLIANVTGKNMLMPIITTLRETKSKQMRPIMMELLEACLANWPTKSLTKRVVEIENTISFGLECPTAETRDAAARSFFLFLQHFPKKEKSVVARLPSRAQRIVERMRGTQTPTAKKASPGKYGSTEGVRTPPADPERPAAGRRPATYLTPARRPEEPQVDRCPPIALGPPKGRERRPKVNPDEISFFKTESDLDAQKIDVVITDGRRGAAQHKDDAAKRGSHNSDNSSVRSSLARAKTHISRARTPSVTKSSRRASDKQKSKSATHAERKRNSKDKRAFGFSRDDVHSNRRESHASAQTDASNRSPSPELFSESGKNSEFKEGARSRRMLSHSLLAPIGPNPLSSKLSSPESIEEEGAFKLDPLTQLPGEDGKDPDALPPATPPHEKDEETSQAEEHTDELVDALRGVRTSPLGYSPRSKRRSLPISPGASSPLSYTIAGQRSFLNTSNSDQGERRSIAEDSSPRPQNPITRLTATSNLIQNPAETNSFTVTTPGGTSRAMNINRKLSLTLQPKPKSPPPRPPSRVGNFLGGATSYSGHNIPRPPTQEKAGAGSVSQTFQSKRIPRPPAAPIVPRVKSMSAAGGEKSHASQGLPMYLLLIKRYQKSIMDTYNMFKRDEIGEEAFAEQVLDILYEQSEKTQSQTAKMRKVLKAARKSRESGSSSESKRHSRTRSDGVGHHISHRMREEAKAEAIKNELPEEY